MYKIYTEVITFIEETMKNLGVELSAGGKRSVKVKIQGGILEGDALSSLLFVIAMMPLNYIFRK